MLKFVERQFTEHDFVATLLALLCQNGVTTLNEKELEKKLFCYYKNSEFSELFQDIVPKKGTIDMEVNLYEGLYQEKFFTSNVMFEQRNSDDLYLAYKKDIDLSRYMCTLSEDGKLKLRQLANELAIRYKIERSSQHKLNIYAYNPNCHYLLVNGKKDRSKLSFELITDGEIEFIEYNKGKEDVFYENPYKMDSATRLTDNEVVYLILRDASYAIKQGLYNGEIRYCNVNTEILDEEKLKQISDIANREYTSDEYAITDEAPYVRKLSLK